MFSLFADCSRLILISFVTYVTFTGRIEMLEIIFAIARRRFDGKERVAIKQITRL